MPSGCQTSDRFLALLAVSHFCCMQATMAAISARAMCRLVQVRQVCTPAVSFNPSARQCRLRVACVATTEDSTAQAAQLTKKAKVAFNLPHHVEFGQELCLVGEVEDLGNWSAESCLPLAWHDGDVWTAECELPAG